MHIIIQKEQVTIFEEIDICIPCSHWFEERKDALEWMCSRGMQHDCYVVSKSRFIQLGGTV